MLQTVHVFLLVACAVLLTSTGIHAAATPEQKCQKARHEAAAKYAQCQTNAIGKFHGGGTTAKLEATLSKCRVKYTGTWVKLQKKALGTSSTCDDNRFVDNGTTVTDNLTALEWEKKTDSGAPHGKNLLYFHDDAYSNLFLGSLNNDPNCFVSRCDWRLPTRAELQTILSEPHPCTTDPCIPGIFGPTSSGFYWTATSHASDDTLAWAVDFDTGFVRVGAPVGSKTTLNLLRAVRGGL